MGPKRVKTGERGTNLGKLVKSGFYREHIHLQGWFLHQTMAHCPVPGAIPYFTVKTL